jgi:putative ABC transport system ATP-binding protein
MIKLERVEKYYGRTHVLKGIDLHVDRGDFVAVAGSSGSGKSTLLNLIGGMDRPDAGRIVVDGQDLSRAAEDDLTLYRRTKVGFVFQFFNLLPNISVLENVQMPLLLNGVDDEERPRDLLRRVGLDGREMDYPHALSGGEQQRVAIARALVHDPPIILADEPTGSLDSKTGMVIMDLLKDMTGEAGKTVVLVTHEHYIAAYANRSVRIRDGLASG